MMHKNLLWQGFLAIVFISAVWFTITALYTYYEYSLLTAHTKTISIDWTIKQKSEDYYFLSANYQFLLQNQIYNGTTDFSSEPYRNSRAAFEEVNLLKGLSKSVWLDPKNPEHSSLAKHFPFKQSLSALLLWGLLLYFLWLGFYVTRFKGSS